VLVADSLQRHTSGPFGGYFLISGEVLSGVDFGALSCRFLCRLFLRLRTLRLCLEQLLALPTAIFRSPLFGRDLASQCLQMRAAARDATGRAAAPPSSVMNWRRLRSSMGSPRGTRCAILPQAQDAPEAPAGPWGRPESSGGLPLNDACAGAHFTYSCQAIAEHFKRCAEFAPLRNRGLGPLAVTVLAIPLARGRLYRLRRRASDSAPFSSLATGRVSHAWSALSRQPRPAGEYATFRS
jgi:hypothetical protein